MALVTTAERDISSFFVKAPTSLGPGQYDYADKLASFSKKLKNAKSISPPFGVGTKPGGD